MALFITFLTVRICSCVLCRVSGFDHENLDEQQQDWHTHMYPYKLASYQKRAFSAPVTLVELDFNGPDNTAALSSTPTTASAVITQHGSCDGVAVWVDYDLGEGRYLSAWDGQDFPVHLTVNVKFFASPLQVREGDCVKCSALLDNDKCDFVYDFHV